MIDELCGCGFKDSCYVHCNHDLEACPGKPYKGSDLVATDNQSQDEPLKSATPDIDTQIEELLANGYIKSHLYRSKDDADLWQAEIRLQLSEEHKKAIKTLLIQQQGGYDKPSDTASVGGNQVGKQSEPFNRREQKRIDTLKRRMRVLEERVNTTTKDLSYDKREASALRWAISLVEGSDLVELRRIEYERHANPQSSLKKELE